MGFVLVSTKQGQKRVSERPSVKCGTCECWYQRWRARCFCSEETVEGSLFCSEETLTSFWLDTDV